MFIIKEFIRKTIDCGSAPAITDMNGRRTFTYRQLAALSDKIAAKLLQLGVRKGDSVILLLPRISEYIATEIALLEIGAVIVPLIPEYPDERVSFIQKDCDAALVIREDFFRSLDEFKQEDLVPDETPNISESRDVDRGMIIFTSGSAGFPKGVVYTRSTMDVQILRKQSSVNDIHPLIFAASASLSFCVAVTEYFTTLTMGGHIHMISDEVRFDTDRLSEYYKAHDITCGFISPGILKGFISRSTHLKRVFTIGEKAVNLFSPDFEIVNSYGLSETVGGICAFVVDRPYDNTPIGRPLNGIEMIVTDPDGNEVADGQEGQLCVIGNLPGQYNRLPGETAKVFRLLPDGRSLVCTGDIGKKLPDGNLLYLNRSDWMIKLHGQRVEPGEIESVMNRVSGITGSIVKAFENEDGTMLLCGFYTEKRPVKKESIMAMLKAKLPSYMIPGAFVRMDTFPVNQNGKTDRKAIEKPDLSMFKAAYEKPVNQVEKAICNAVQEVLHIDRAGRNDNFFELGGNSINAAALASISGLKGLSIRDIMLGQPPAGIALQYEKNADIRKPVLDHKYKPEREYPMTLSNHYFFYDAESIGEPIDWTDVRCLYRLDRTTDEERLRQAIEDSLRAHKVYGIRFDPSGMILRNEAYDTSVGEVTIDPEKFGAYRMKKSSQKRDLLRQSLFEFEIVRAGKTRFLYLNLSHLLADQVSINLLFDEISDRYEGREPVREDYDYFDVAAYEGELKGSDFRREALRFFDSQFGDLRKKPAGACGNYPICSVSREIGAGLSQTQKTKFLKQNGVSESTYIQAALFLTLAKFLDQNRLICQIFHSGRDGSAYDNLHGCVARATLLRADIGRTKATGDFLNELQKTWQDTVYYDVIPIQELVVRYPQAESFISLNYRGNMKRSFHLGEKKLPSLPLGYLAGFSHRQAWLQFYIDELADGKLAIDVFGEGYFSYQETERLVNAFERALGLILVCERVDAILKGI